MLPQVAIGPLQTVDFPSEEENEEDTAPRIKSGTCKDEKILEKIIIEACLPE